MKQAGEIAGLDGVTIIGYDVNGIMATTTSELDGNYIIPDELAYPIRVEFRDISSAYLYTSTPMGASNPSTVQFIDAPSCEVDLAVNNPADFCEDDAPLAVTCSTNGDPLATDASVDASPTAANLDTLVFFDGDARGDKNPALMTMAGTGMQTGAVWGVAYDKYSKTLYSAAFIKRHVGLEPLGIGGIYAYDVDNLGAGSQPWLDLETLGVDVELLDSMGNVITNTTTSSAGDYFFGSLPRGDYQVRIPNAPADAPISSTPTDTADNDEDGDDNGTQAK